MLPWTASNVHEEPGADRQLRTNALPWLDSPVAALPPRGFALRYLHRDGVHLAASRVPVPSCFGNCAAR